MTREAAVFLFVPPAPSSTMNRSASAIAPPMSVAPSMSITVIGRVFTVALAREPVMSPVISPTNVPEVVTPVTVRLSTTFRFCRVATLPNVFHATDSNSSPTVAASVNTNVDPFSAA